MDSPEMDLVYGLIGTVLYIFRNPDRKFLYTVAVFVMCLFASQWVYFYFDELTGYVIWIFSALGLLITYSLRVMNRHQKGILKFIKVGGLLLLAIYPLPFIDLVYDGDSIFWIVTRMLTFFVLALIYLYDRWILKPEKMKKKFIIILLFQSFLILILLLFSLIQRAEADKMRERAENSSRKADEAQVHAEEMRAKYQKLVEEMAGDVNHTSSTGQK